MTKDDLFFASILKDAKFITDLEIPLIKREEKCDLNNIVSFNSKIKDLHNLENLFFHFYDVNLKFEDYLKLFLYKKFAKIKFCKGIIMPNLNIKDNENIIEYIYKIYQNRQLIYFFQKHGLIVIPTIDWYDFLSINYSLISLFKYGIYAIYIRNKINYDLNIKCFKKCMRKIILKLKPLSIWFYDDNKQIKVDIFANKNKLNFLDISNLVLGFFNKK
ncbi:DUF4417 domain-containing protein [Ureaplasma urealyticum]|uniref:DUF4417 domain-containing protein n=1 Tax=Ureaplasma urealyticum TaxID=2130 RepID=UPI00209C3981|nr:DUF4417 domain-containing protein [Ureaplasma urealyticum]